MKEEFEDEIISQFPNPSLLLTTLSKLPFIAVPFYHSLRNNFKHHFTLFSRRTTSCLSELNFFPVIRSETDIQRNSVVTGLLVTEHQNNNQAGKFGFQNLTFIPTFPSPQAYITLITMLSRNCQCHRK